MGVDPGHLFSIDGDKLLIDQNMPASPPKTEAISIIATDNVTGAYAVQNITVGVNAATESLSVAATAVETGAVETGPPAAPTAPTAQITADTVGAAAGAATPIFLAGPSESLVLGAGATIIGLGTSPGEVWGGNGPDTYVYQGGEGTDTIGNFSIAKGDILSIDQSLQGSLRESASAGGTMLSFGDGTHGILLAGVSNFSTSQIHWS